MDAKPSTVSSILTDHFHTRAAELNFSASCELFTAHLLGTMAASKPGGQVLELGASVDLGNAHLASVVRIWTG